MVSLVTTNRDLNKLSPNFKKKVNAFLKEVWDIIFVTEWRRSKQRQEYLYAQWRTRPWNIVTRTLNSLHLSWDAIDIAFKWKTLYPTEIDKRLNIYSIAKKYWIDNLYQLKWVEKVHLQDNWKPFINNTWPKIWTLLKTLLNISVKLLWKYRSTNSIGRDDTHSLANQIRSFIKKYS